jgi:hypothetical protein
MCCKQIIGFFFLACFALDLTSSPPSQGIPRSAFLLAYARRTRVQHIIITPYDFTARDSMFKGVNGCWGTLRVAEWEGGGGGHPTG